VGGFSRAPSTLKTSEKLLTEKSINFVFKSHMQWTNVSEERDLILEVWVEEVEKVEYRAFV